MDDDEFVLAMIGFAFLLGMALMAASPVYTSPVNPEITGQEAIEVANRAGYAQCHVFSISDDSVTLNCLTDNDAMADAVKVTIGYQSNQEVAITS